MDHAHGACGAACTGGTPPLAPTGARSHAVRGVPAIALPSGPEDRGTNGAGGGHASGGALLRFIAKVPGLQKIGQVLARNSNLDPRLRRALIQLENGIADVTVDEIHGIIRKQLQSQIETYAINLKPAILSEASVSAVVGFSWRNPESGRRERGVFKVLKPHIPSCYAEDMKIIGQLAQHLARKHRAEGPRLGRLAETLTEIRLLLEREVDF